MMITGEVIQYLLFDNCIEIYIIVWKKIIVLPHINIVWGIKTIVW